MPPSKRTFKQILEELKRNKSSDTREVDSKGEREYYLIVCEGEKTEPNYFRTFKDKLPKNVVDTVDISGEGANTLTVVRTAITRKRNREADPLVPSYDKVYAVFDKDGFSAQQVNSAVMLAEDNGIIPCLSNECFELWYILHFQLLDACILRSQYMEVLSNILGSPYAKNDVNIVQKINELGDVKQAIAWARQLDDMHEECTPYEACPSTKVYKLVEDLLEYLEEHGVN